MLKTLDRFIDSITMYRLLLYYLIGLLLAAMILGQLGQLAYAPFEILLSTLILVIACWAANKGFATLLRVPTNYESSLITALILALIITPLRTTDGASFLLAASGLAMASKYLLTIRQKHLFNPAAIAVTLTALGPQQSASWWVGTAAMLPFVIVGGVLLIRKLRRTPMVLSFLGSAYVVDVLFTLFNRGNIMAGLKELTLSTALFFLAFVMLTEPLTSPTTRRKQIWYGLLVGGLFPPQVHLLSLYSTPERALVVGNILAYLVSPKTKLFPVLKQRLKTGPSSMDFVFEPGQKFAYQPGQYMEWTLPHNKVDARGNRRYFTLASSPTESEVRLGVKFYQKGSSYKKAMLAMNSETKIVASQIAGDFVLPHDPKQKVVFIAGGIGVTPYRSMIKYLLDKQEQRSIALLYAARTAEDIAYQEVFEAARQQLGVSAHYILSEPDKPPLDNRYRDGHVDAAMIRALVPDYAERLFYISGPQPMVEAVRHNLSELGVAAHQIKLDFFPGYA